MSKVNNREETDRIRPMGGKRPNLASCFVLLSCVWRENLLWTLLFGALIWWVLGTRMTPEGEAEEMEDFGSDESSLVSLGCLGTLESLEKLLL
eukprot:1261540-Amphidinium_carterae.1